MQARSPAPPVYRPQQKPSALQQRRMGGTPPPYRPQFTGVNPPPRPVQAKLRSPAPPVYRPFVQPKIEGNAPPVYRPARPAQGQAPPVYRHQSGTLRASESSVQRKTGISAPPVYRPNKSGVTAPPVYRPVVQRAVASGPRAPQLNGKTIQPLMGMELELPIVVLTDKEAKTQLKVPFLRGDNFKVEADHSSRFGNAITQDKDEIDDPTILEIVMDPFDEQDKSAEDTIFWFQGDVDDFVNEIEKLTEKRTQPITIKILADALGLKVQNGADNYLVGVPTTNPAKNPHKALVHFTIGVGYSRLGDAMTWIRKHSRERKGAEITHEMSAIFSGSIREVLQNSNLSLQHQNLVANFCTLAYNNAIALDLSKSRTIKGQGVQKNFTYMLSRVPFISTLKALPKEPKAFVLQNAYGILSVMGKDFKTEEGLAYFQDILRGDAKAQSYYWGGMKELKVEQVGPSFSEEKGIPLELRGIGNSRQDSEEWVENAKKLISASQSRFLQIPEWLEGLDLPEIFSDTSDFPPPPPPPPPNGSSGTLSG